MTRTCLSLAVALLVAAGGIAPAAAQAPGKRLIRIHTAGPNDLGVDNTSPGSRLHMSRTATYRWLVANAHRFGFVPYV